MTGTATRRTASSRSRSRSVNSRFTPQKTILLLAGLILLVLAAPPFFTFPWLQYWLLPIAALYFLWLWIIPRLWLFALPLATVGFDLTPWTGRFSYNELDLLFLATLASGLIYGRYRLKVFSPSVALLVALLFALVVALGFRGWTLLALPPQAVFDNPYYTSEYAYKVLKGLLWGVLLVPMWGYLLAQNKRRAVNSLIAGMSLSAILLGLIVLWERGTLGVLLDLSAWYHILDSLLDLSSSYRVTGLFSDMHTGGETIDGVLLLLLPATLYGSVSGDRTWLRLLAGLGFLALAYVALVGFTRATYPAFAFALLLFAMLVLRSRRKAGLADPVPVVPFLVTLGIGIVVAVVTYRLAGSYGLLTYSGLALLAFAGDHLRFPGYLHYLPQILAALCIAFALYAHFSSRWAEPSLPAALIMAMTMALFYSFAIKLRGNFGDTSGVNRLLSLVGLVLLPAIVAFATGGYQIKDRISHVGADFETRQSHWQNVIGSSRAGKFSSIFGNGVGSFPSSYITSYPHAVKELGSYNVKKGREGAILRVGGGRDLKIAQRVSIAAHTDYVVSVHLRTERAGRLQIALCERNVIFASNFAPTCVTKAIKLVPTQGLLKKHNLEINSGRVGEKSTLWRWPTELTVHYGDVGSVLEIGHIDLAAEKPNLLRNGSFDSGLDYWFQYNDFAHLPWHVKNVFLQIWFENGWLGLILFSLLLVLLLRGSLTNGSHDSLRPVYTVGVLAVCLFGLFGSPLDSARVSWMFYFFLFSGLAKLRVEKPSYTGKIKNSTV